MADCCRKEKRIVLGLALVCLLIIPCMANGSESTSLTSKPNTERQQSSSRASSSSSFMNWAQRFGNRVGKNLSEAASKTASAIKQAVADNNEKHHIEESPSDN